MNAPASELCTTTEAVKLLGVSRTRVRQLLNMEVLEGSKDGGRYRITRRSIYARIAASDAPPGVQRLLYWARLMRDLTASKPKKPYGYWGARNWKSALNDFAYQMFGTEEAEPYRVRLHETVCELLKAGKLKEWRYLDRVRDEVDALMDEYDFVAAPLGGPLVEHVTKCMQISLFEGEA